MIAMIGRSLGCEMSARAARRVLREEGMADADIAVAAIGRRLGVTGSRLRVRLTGGDLLLEYAGTGTIRMTGPAAEVFQDLRNRLKAPKADP